MDVTTRFIAELSLDPNNVRQHPDKNLDTIARSLSRFGQRKPIVVTPEGIVVAGNGTLQAARSLGWDEIATVTTPEGWTSDQITAYAIADNRSAELAEWDKPLVDATLEELALSGIDLADLGFDLNETASTERDTTPKTCPHCGAEL